MYFATLVYLKIISEFFSELKSNFVKVMFLNPMKTNNTYNGANFFVIVTLNQKNTKYQRGL